MITTDPKYNKPEKCICARCGKTFIRSPWSSVYSTNKRHLYRYYKIHGTDLFMFCFTCVVWQIRIYNYEKIIR